MLSSGDLLFMCGVNKQKYQTRSRQNQYLYVAVSCELLTDMTSSRWSDYGTRHKKN